MSFDIWAIIGLVIFLVVALFAVRRALKPFFWRITFCLVPVIVGAYVALTATHHYLTDGGGFKLGVDLVGGTILVYEVDPTRMTEEKKKEFKPDLLAARLKRRLDPNDLYNI